MEPQIRIDGPAPRLRGFRYFWAKKVRGFSRGSHCARCLIGPYEKSVANDMFTGEWIELEQTYEDGAILYICGVSSPYRHELNAHLALRIDRSAQDPIFHPIHGGQTISFRGATKIEFDGQAAAKLFPDRGQSFLTCRNFQFAAQHFAAEAC